MKKLKIVSLTFIFLTALGLLSGCPFLLRPSLFTKSPVYFNVNGGKGSVKATIDGREIKSGIMIPKGTTVVLTASPDDPSTHMVDLWTGLSEPYPGETTIRFTVTTGATIGIRFIKKDEPRMYFTTSETSYSFVRFSVDAATEEDKAGIWVDLNNNGTQDEGEKINEFNTVVYYDNKEGAGQTYTVHGKVTVLNCSTNRFASIDVSQNTVLKTLNCDGNNLTSLDVSKNIMLENLNCDGYGLTNLDVSKNTALKHLGCSYSRLTSLDLSQNTALETVSCFNNLLTSLDVSNNTALEELSCFDNALTSLDISKNTALKKVSCYDNQLISLDVSQNTVLESLNCKENELSTLDVSQNSVLTDLDCGANALTTLNVSHNDALKTLHCNYNRLTSLDVSKNTALVELDCGGNSLTSLDISQNTDLILLGCYKNNIQSTEMEKIINALPIRTQGDTGAFYAIDTYGEPTEKNAIPSSAQIKRANDKNWTVYDYKYWRDFSTELKP